MVNGSHKDSRSSQPCLHDLLVVNQVAGPLMVQMLEDFCRAGVCCKIVTGWVDSENPRQLPFEIIPAGKLEKSPNLKRIWSWMLFTLQACRRMIRHRKTPVLMVTNPPWPMLLMPLLKRILGLRYVLLIYDIYPDVLERMGRMRRGGLIGRLWRLLSRKSLLEADGVITLGPYMAETLVGHLCSGDKCPIEVISNWADTDFIRPIEKAQNPFAARHGLTDRFVVTYSGAFGATHDVESIVKAAEMLTDLSEVHFLLIGGGTRRKEVRRLVEQKNLPNLTLLPFQPFDMLPYSLPAADCSIVCLDEGYEGLSVPSKTYYAMAAGSALLAISRDNTELTDIVKQYQCGFHILPHRPEDLAEAVRRLCGDRELLEKCKTASRRAAEENFARNISTRRYLEYLRKKLCQDRLLQAHFRA
ncbi:MAG: glycosyltransferase family 4 protein [Planctomycetota bacterium]|nr:glycosyltransferase family 4 protein [Planctomycetota bacterium]